MRELLKRLAKRFNPVAILLLFGRVLWGFRLYCKIKRKYGEDVQILLCPHKGTGDICMIGRYLDAYLGCKNITNSLFLFRGEAEQRVGNLFHIDNGMVITERETVLLSRLLAFVGQRYLDIHHLHHVPLTPQIEITSLLEGYNGISFDDMFRYYTFGFGDVPVMKTEPCFSAEKEYLQGFFFEKNFRKHKTVIISPYASSMPPLPEQMWDELVDKLLDEGYTVATNCLGGKEVPLKNTTPISPAFSIMGPILEEAGYFIGWRSGLCDLISGCECKKIILYPYAAPNAMWTDWPGKTYAYFGLANCDECHDAIEIEFDERHIPALAKTIYGVVTEKDRRGKLELIGQEKMRS